MIDVTDQPLHHFNIFFHASPARAAARREAQDATARAAQPAARPPRIHRIALDRQMGMAQESVAGESSRTIKADAARLLFNVRCDRIRWAVIDSGIHVGSGGFGQGEALRVELAYDFSRLTRWLALAQERQGSEASRLAHDELRRSIEETFIRRDPEVRRIRPRVLEVEAQLAEAWFWVLWVSAVLTMLAGNLAALVQSNVKRMLAYSSIAHAGYILVAFAAQTKLGIAAVLFYLAAYALMKVGAFTIVSHLGESGERRLDIRDYAGLGVRQPFTAAAFSLFLLSLLGLPVTAGFLGKLYIFNAALDAAKQAPALAQPMMALAILLAVNSVIAAYYYLRLMMAMYFQEPASEWTRTSPGSLTVPGGWKNFP